jgi:cob(I)alamin adenosyltransferase
MVKINWVYTRTGDDGRTVLSDGARLPKFHIRVAAYGSVEKSTPSSVWHRSTSRQRSKRSFSASKMISSTSVLISADRKIRLQAGAAAGD